MTLSGFHIGDVHVPYGLIAAPMAGVTDRPFRALCRQLGADVAVSEMLISDKRLWHTQKSRNRMNHEGETGPIVVQIAGAEPVMMADAAIESVRLGAAIIDINMGCPAKKVCNKYAGSALLENEALVEEIVEAVVDAVDVPVTLKIRTGPTRERRNAVRVARIAERCGIRSLAVHGRTREEKYAGEAEYNTIADVKQAVSIPVIANGDINDGPKARQVLKATQVDGLMIGRAAQGNPWIFSEIRHYLEHGECRQSPTAETVRSQLIEHVQALHRFYGPQAGMRVARKHIGWYLKQLPDARQYRRELVTIETPWAQLAKLSELPIVRH